MVNFSNSVINDRQSSLDLNHYNQVAVIGVGGIGSWVALNLALSGNVGELILIDPDVIETSNLNRTPFRLYDIGQLKVDAMRDLILERRVVPVVSIPLFTTDDGFENMFNGEWDRSDRTAIIDCRDNIFQDMYDWTRGPYYKVGYDGFDISIDGNPKESMTLRESATTGYRVTPSFICPAQLAANLVVTDLLARTYTERSYKQSDNYKLFDLISFNVLDILDKVNTTHTLEGIENE